VVQKKLGGKKKKTKLEGRGLIKHRRLTRAGKKGKRKKKKKPNLEQEKENQKSAKTKVDLIGKEKSEPD